MPFDPRKFVASAAAKGWPVPAACGVAAVFEFAQEQLDVVRDTSRPREERDRAALLLGSVLVDVTTAARQCVQELCGEIPAADAAEIASEFEKAVGAVRGGGLKLVRN